MAPSLKEINVAGSSAAARVVVAARRNAGGAGKGQESMKPDTMVHGNNAAVKGRGNAAAKKNSQGECAATTAAAISEQTLSRSSTSRSPTATTVATTITIQHEDPAKVPDDESAFLIAPHFHRNNPFHRNLSTLDLSMRCAICSEFYKAPVTLLPCLHNFCSLCVRNHFKATYTGMKRKANCPQCNEPVRMPGSNDYENGILPNKQLEQQVDNYVKCRNEMRKKLVRLDVLEKEKIMGVEFCENSLSNVGKRGNTKYAQGTRSSKRACRTVAKETNYTSENEDVNSDEDGDSDEDYICDQKAQSTSSSNETVSKPPPAQQLKRKAKASYHGMNKKKLVELCRKEGLNTQGNDKELKQRHSDFIMLYNSECDSEHPRSVRELVKEMKDREKSIKEEASDIKTKRSSRYMASLGSSLDSYHKGSVSKPSSGNEIFDSKMNENFAEMIAGLKNRKAGGEPNSSVSCEKEVAVKCNGDLHAKGGDIVHGVASSNNEVGEGQTSIETSQQPAGVLEKNDEVVLQKGVGSNHEVRESHTGITSSQKRASLPEVGVGRIRGDAASPTASMDSDSDKTLSVDETPQPLRPKNNFKEKSSSPSKLKAPSAKHAPRSTAKKPKSSTANNNSGKSRHTDSSRVTRVSSLGPWVCSKCTFQNLRNTTKKAMCEMCSTARPEVSAGSNEGHGPDDMEVVNIDC